MCHIKFQKGSHSLKPKSYNPSLDVWWNLAFLLAKKYFISYVWIFLLLLGPFFKTCNWQKPYQQPSVLVHSIMDKILVLTSSYGHSRTSARRLARSLASFLVTIAQGLVAAADWRIAWEKYGRDPGESKWKATLADPADSEMRPLNVWP